MYEICSKCHQFLEHPQKFICCFMLSFASLISCCSFIIVWPLIRKCYQVLQCNFWMD